MLSIRAAGDSTFRSRFAAVVGGDTDWICRPSTAKRMRPFSADTGVDITPELRRTSTER
jgi:hypothetical protein